MTISNDRHIRGYTTEENCDIAAHNWFFCAVHLEPKAELFGWA
jgi:hypothetical protein